MTTNNHELLEKYIDNELSDVERLTVDVLLSKDPLMVEDLAALQASKKAVRLYGINNEVAAIQKQYLANQTTTAKRAVVRSIFRTGLRVAASVIIIVAAYGTFKYTSVDQSELFADNFSSYELNRVRGASNPDQVENAYLNKDWKTVTQLVKQVAAPGNKELFLAGMAQLELNQAAEAINSFNQVLANNQRGGLDYFNDEAEYYLALSYIKNSEAAKAIPILEKIRADKNHLFYQSAGEVSILDIKMLSWKGK